jgi:hypothetical protein
MSAFDTIAAKNEASPTDPEFLLANSRWNPGLPIRTSSPDRVLRIRHYYLSLQSGYRDQETIDQLGTLLYEHVSTEDGRSQVLALRDQEAVEMLDILQSVSLLLQKSHNS